MAVVLYSKANCPQCVKVKAELDANGTSYVEVKVDQHPAAREFLLSEGHRSVPQVYYNNVHVKDLTTVYGKE